ncbi:MAG: hypothetical protein ACFFD3_04495 [Candidatus Thorarchaeota archaeon]
MGLKSRVDAMSTGQTTITQLQLGDAVRSKDLLMYSPPGITVETAKYPILMAGVLASTQPHEFLSIYDHPTAWRGLDREAIFSMRRNLYRLLIPADARSLIPQHAIETLQTIALSVSPVALGVEAATLPPRRLHTSGGDLPASPSVIIKSLEILSDPEISRVAERITQKDITASEAIIQLFEYDYALEQIVRMLAIGLLGRKEHRRLVPTKNAFKVVIDSFIDKTLLDLSEQPFSTSISLQKSELFGDSFIIVSIPGEARVDYFRVEIAPDRTTQGYSLESRQQIASDPKTALFASHARFPVYSELKLRNENSHNIIFHLNRDGRNNAMGPWLPRAGVEKALCEEPVVLDSTSNMISILESLVYPNLEFWARNTPLMTRLGISAPNQIETPITR